MLTENQITQKLADYLVEHGFSIRQQLNTLQKGIDLIAEDKEGCLIYIEVKGETSASKGSKRYGLPFSPNQIWSHVSVALLKTLTVINAHPGDDNKFGMAFPMNHKHLIQSIKPSLDKLSITVYLVSENIVEIL